MNLIKFLTLTATFFSSNILFSAVEKTPIVPTLSKPTAKTVSQSKNIPSEHVKAAIDTAPKTVPAAKTMTSTTSVNPHAAPVSSTAKPKMAVSKNNGSSHVIVPYLKELQNAQMSPAIIAGWQELYEKFLQANDTNSSPTADSSAVIPGLIQDPANLKTLLTTNFFNLMAAYLHPASFPKLANDPDSQIHFNYATTHLRDTAIRLGSISSITDVSGAPTVQFKGDCRDMGIIVNIQNNTDAQFSINQTSLDGTKTIQIGQLNPGLNEVNLHTAALQTSADATKSTIATTSNYFEIVENGTESTIQINLKIMSGTEFVTFLQSLPKNDPSQEPDTVLMNGLPTSSKYLATPQDWYLVLIQNVSTTTASTPNPNQRIQAINLSKISEPYLLSMQINQEPIKIKSTTMNVLQPSITTALKIQNKSLNTTKYPLFILPQFLWNNPTLQAYWMLINSNLIATLSDDKFFGPKTFGDAFEYFSGLGCFDMQHKYAFCIDLYNLLKPGNQFHDTSWLIGSGLFATDLQHCKDFPQLHSSQDSNGNIIANGSGFFYLNFKVQLYPQATNEPNNNKLFATKGFLSVYAKPSYQSCNFLCSILTTDIKDGVFAELTEIQSGVYNLLWTDKKNKHLNHQFLYLNNPIDKITIDFINQNKNWTGSIVPSHLLNLKIGIKNDFKVTYESMPTANKHLLSIQATSPIDKSGIIRTTYFKTLPITDLYYDLYKTFQGADFTRCHIIQNGNLPLFLSNLTTQDWKNGIYLIPSIIKNTHTISQNPEYLTVTFYKSDKTLLGSINSKGYYQNNPATPGIQHFVNFYSIYSNAFNPLFDGALASGILIKNP